MSASMRAPASQKAADSPGVGLGLAIARDIVQAHGGEIVAQSAFGEGTVVTLIMPDRSRGPSDPAADPGVQAPA
jgi:signal transduction histidine kinase